MSKSVTIIEPTHPGEVLRDEFMEPLGLSARALAARISVPANRITEILKAKRGMTAETAILLSKAFGTSSEFWVNLQSFYDLQTASQNPETLSKARSIEPYEVA
ncbi:MAG: HigA family addiction module antitoxin [Pseudomonadota bacterium]